jgi:hypothetical protein
MLVFGRSLSLVFLLQYDKDEKMTNSIMFFIGLTIVIIYTFFLLGIILKQRKTSKRKPMLEFDVEDLDGMGNQGRVPTKEPKNRA